MRIFIYEFACGGGLAGQPGLAALRTEGRAMLAALFEDLQRLPGVQAITILEDSWELEAEPSAVSTSPAAVRRVPAGQEESAFREAAGAADYTLVIAPECAGILATRRRWVGEVGGRWLGCSFPAIELCADKLILSQYLAERRIPTPPSRPYGPEEPLPTFPLPWVWKPRQGAGSQATFLVRQPDELPAYVDHARHDGWTGDSILQPFVPGSAASVAFLIGPQKIVPLLPASQELSNDGRFRYHGGRIPLPAPLAERAVRLAKRAVAVVPGLSGYVGMDIVLGNAADGCQDVVIEINPRLTTSYIGLRALARTNLAGALLAVTRGEGILVPAWQARSIRFFADGTILR